MTNKKEYQEKYNKEYYLKNKERINLINKKYYEENKERLLEINKEWIKNNKDRSNELKNNWNKNNRNKINKYNEENKEKLSASQKEWSNEHKDEIKKYMKEYNEENKESLKEKSIKYRIENEEKIKERKRKYYEENKEKINENNKLRRQTDEYKEWKRQYEIGNKYISVWRDMLRNSLRRMNISKNDKTINLLGYSAHELKSHLENLFLDGMSWENKNLWDVDHIIPLSIFKENTPIHVVNSLENLQPLWSKDNNIKFNKVEETEISNNLIEKFKIYLNI